MKSRRTIRAERIAKEEMKQNILVVLGFTLAIVAIVAVSAGYHYVTVKHDLSVCTYNKNC